MAASRGIVRILRKLPSRPFHIRLNDVRAVQPCRVDHYTTASSSIVKQQSGSDTTGDARKTPLYHSQSRRFIKTSNISRQTDADTAQTVDAVGEEEDQGNFDRFGISPDTQRALKRDGIERLFPVQIQCYKYIQNGSDVVVKSRTGTGKTLAFALPLVEKLLQRSKQYGDRPKVIVLAPTRELACQVEEHVKRLNKEIRVASVYGGAPYTQQERAIRSGLDIVIGTPGRMKDMIERGVLSLSDIEHVILDEMDRMLDMGFQEPVDDILSESYRASKPQTLMFSATVPSYVKTAAKKYLSSDVLLIDMIGDDNIQAATTVKQMICHCDFVDGRAVQRLIQQHCEPHGKTIVFCETKRECHQFGRFLSGGMALHGDVPQNRRALVLEYFKSGRLDILVTTDVAARGLDIPNVDLIVQISPPNNIENFIHRTGRTGRAGKSGKAIMIYSRESEYKIKECEKVANTKFLPIQMSAIDRSESIKSAIRKFEKVNVDDAMDICGAQVKELQQELGSEGSLAVALVLLSKISKEMKSSLLTQTEGFRTFQFRMENEDLSEESFSDILSGIVNKNQIKGLCTNKGKDSFFFDAPLNLFDVLSEGLKENQVNGSLTKLVVKLPADIQKAEQKGEEAFSSDSYVKRSAFESGMYGDRRGRSSRSGRGGYGKVFHQRFSDSDPERFSQNRNSSWSRNSRDDNDFDGDRRYGSDFNRENIYSRSHKTSKPEYGRGQRYSKDFDHDY